MPNALRASYACFARWTFSAVNYAVCSGDAALRSGTWHEGVLTDDVALRQRFIEGLSLGEQVRLTLTDGAGGTYRTLAANNTLDGTAVTIECVCSVSYDDGSSAEQLFAAQYTIVGYELNPGLVTLLLADVEDERLKTLYPPAQWTTAEVSQLHQDHAGKPIPHPVGTALKLPCALLRADEANVEWWYGICEAVTSSYAITGINTGAKQFQIAGDHTDKIGTGSVVFVGDYGELNAGRYTVTAASHAAGTTTVTVAEAISDGTVSGSLVVPPRVLAVYRSGRLVGTSEYTVEWVDPNSQQPQNPDFASASGWTPANVGTGTATIASGKLTLTGDGGTTNYGQAQGNPSGGTPALIGSMSLRRVTLAGTGKVRIGQGSNSEGPFLSGAKVHGFIIRRTSVAGRVVFISNRGTGSSANVDVDNLAVVSRGLLLLRFTREQVDYNGNLYTIEADVYAGGESRNVVDEIERLLEYCGATVDASSFATAQAYAATHKMLVDCDYGRAGQRRVDAILREHLFLARATLNRGGTGAYVITQDKAGSSTATLDEDLHDLVAVEKFTKGAIPKTVALSYRPSPRNPGELQHTITRTVTGGVVGDQPPVAMAYVRDHETADRLLCYLALRAHYNRRITGRRLLATAALGDVVTIYSALNYPGARDWTIWSRTSIAAGFAFEGLEYAAAVHTYSAGSLPPDAETTYQPDYSATPPLAPTALIITAGSTATANDGTMTARVAVECVPPTVNWSELWFKCIHNVTGEISALVRGDYNSGTGKVTSTLTALRPGEVYKLHAAAVNAFNVQGVVQDTFNATAIGGGASATTFTAPGQPTLPPDVTGIARTQGMGRIVNVTWNAVTFAALWGYVLERQINGGGYSEVWRGQSTNYRDTAVNIDDAYQYRVKARDTYGNVSANWNTGTSITPVGNVTGGTAGNDIGSGTVTTANRNGVTTVSTTSSIAAGAGSDTWAISHSLGKTPIAPAAACISSGTMWTNVSKYDTANVEGVTFRMPTNANLGTGDLEWDGNADSCTINAMLW